MDSMQAHISKAHIILKFTLLVARSKKYWFSSHALMGSSSPSQIPVLLSSAGIWNDDTLQNKSKIINIILGNDDITNLFM